MWKNITIVLLMILCGWGWIFAFRQYIQAEANKVEAVKMRQLVQQQKEVAVKEAEIARGVVTVLEKALKECQEDQ